MIQREFVLFTNHQALKNLNTHTTVNHMHARWISFIQCFTFFIIHKFGKSNNVADALSCKTMSLEAFVPRFLVLNTWQIYTQKMKILLQHGRHAWRARWEKASISKMHFVNICEGKIIARAPLLRAWGSFWVDKTLQQLEARIHWPQAKRDVENSVDIVKLSKLTKSNPKTSAYILHYWSLNTPGWISQWALC